MDLLREVGVRVGDYSSASHPTEMQRLVMDGYGLALIREGTPLDPELTTRPILGVDWTVDTAFVYHRKRHPETIPVLYGNLGGTFPRRVTKLSRSSPPNIRKRNGGRKRPLRPNEKEPEQMLLLG